MVLQGYRGMHPIHYVCSLRHLHYLRYNMNFHIYTSHCEIFYEFNKSREAILQLLLDLNVCPNLIDDNLDTPLHLVASQEFPKTNWINILLDNGAHYDSKNLDGKTFTDILETNAQTYIHNPLSHITLQCLAARTIRQHGIDFTNEIPRQLINFVSNH